MQLLERVEMKGDPNLQSGTNGSRPATVTIRMKNGQSRMLHQKFPKGSPEVPMTRDELEGKFRACTREALGDSAADRALGYVSRLEGLTTIRPLTELFRGA